MLWVKLFTAPQKKQKSGTTCRKRLSMPGDDSDEELPSKRAKGSESTSSHKCGSNHGKHLKKMTEVDIIVEDLKTRHDESRKYSPEQIRAVYNHWTGLVDWTGGLDWWTDTKNHFHAFE